MQLRGLYAITDDILTPAGTLLSQAETALRAGVRILQYRNKTDTDDAVEEICVSLQKLCRRHGTLFIIDDRVRLARRICADGLHIGKDDMDVSEARRLFPEGILGVSCYGSIRKALEAQEAGADYVAFGSFFPSPTKPASGIVSKSVLSRAKELLVLPVCAIGGIDTSNIHEIASHRPDMISVVSAIWNGDIARNVKHLTQGMNV